MLGRRAYAYGKGSGGFEAGAS